MSLVKFIRPSNADRILRCSKSLEYEHLKDKQHAYTIRGIALHKLAEVGFKNNIDKKKYYKMNNLYKYTNEDKNFIKEYIDYINFISTNVIKKEVEYKINIPILNINGTVDYFYYDDNVLHIIDLKTGFNKVEIEDNYQLIIYAYSLLQEIKKDFKFIIVTIYQYGNYYDYITTPYELKKDIEIIKNKINDIKNNKLIYKPSYNTCKYCKGIDICKYATITKDN